MYNEFFTILMPNVDSYILEEKHTYYDFQLSYHNFNLMILSYIITASYNVLVNIMPCSYIGSIVKVHCDLINIKICTLVLYSRLW